MEEITYNVLF